MGLEKEGKKKVVIYVFSLCDTDHDSNTKLAPTWSSVNTCVKKNLGLGSRTDLVDGTRRGHFVEFLGVECETESSLDTWAESLCVT
jgi:hypothetical protein